MSNSSIALRVYRDGLHLIIKPHLSITEIEAAIEKEMSRMNRPLTGVSVQIDLKSPILQDEEVAYLTSKLKEAYNLTVRGIAIADEPIPEPIAAAPTKHIISHAVNTESDNRDSEPSRIAPYTIRSGQTEDFPQGSLIIYGNVNSGAEVRSGGDIIILGALRGNAHAGMNGRLSSVIIAMDLVPAQLLQIGNYVKRPPIDPKSRGYPEIARIEADDIIVEKFVKL